MTDFFVNLAVAVAIFAMLSSALNILVGYTGVLSMSHAAIFGIGAYTAAVLMVDHGWGYASSLLAAIVLGCAVSAVVAIPSLRVSGDYFAVASFGTQFVVSDVFTNLVDVTRGPAGIPGIPEFSIGRISTSTPQGGLVVAVAFLVVTLVLVRVLVRSRFGLTLRAVRDDETGAQALGKSVALTKVMAAVISGGLAAAAGTLYAVYYQYISPETFDIHQSILVLTMVIIGGVGTIWGPVVGAVLLGALPELLRFLEVPYSLAGPIQQLIYATALLLAAMFLPQGIVAEREPRTARAMARMTEPAPEPKVGSGRGE